MDYNELLRQGYKIGKIKDLTFIDDIDVSQKEIIHRFRKDSFLSSLFLLLTSIITIIVAIFAIFFAPDTDLPVLKYISIGIVLTISIGAILVIFLRVLGPAKVANGYAANKYTRSSRSRNPQKLHFVSVYQSTPKKIYVKNIQVNKSQYEEIHPGDRVVIVRSVVGGSVYRE